jgi:hypothetical protein
MLSRKEGQVIRIQAEGILFFMKKYKKYCEQRYHMYPYISITVILGEKENMLKPRNHCIISTSSMLDDLLTLKSTGVGKHPITQNPLYFSTSSMLDL